MALSNLKVAAYLGEAIVKVWKHNPDVVRGLRLLRDDLMMFADAAGLYVAIQRCEGDLAILAKLNRNPAFWNGIIASLQTAAIVTLGRIHDNRRAAYLKVLFRDLEKEASEATAVAMAELKSIIEDQQPFIEQCKVLRDNLFAHTNFHAPVYASQGFERLTIDMIEIYWDRTAAAALQLERTILPTGYSPALDPRRFAKAGAEALAYLSAHS